MIEDVLRERADTIRDGWVASALAAWPAETRAAWGRERDRFQNPVGHGLRAGLARVLDTLLDGGDTDELRLGLAEIVRTRAVQTIPAAEAVGFVFRLKDIVRAELDRAPDGAPHGAEVRWATDELVAFERRIDLAALVAFDLYLESRERVSELRIAELKRTIPWALQRTGFAGCANSVPGLPDAPAEAADARSAERVDEETG